MVVPDPFYPEPALAENKLITNARSGLKNVSVLVTGRLHAPDEGNLDHVLHRSRGGRDTWENLVWAAKEVNQRKADRLPHEAGLKLLTVPRAPKELPATQFLRNLHGVTEWELFLKP